MPNQFNSIQSGVGWKELNSVYLLGSPIVEDGIVTKEVYFHEMGNCLRNVDNEIIYFPHRRESSEKLQEMEQSFGLKYREINIPIELFILNERRKPKAVISFFSTALVSLNIILKSVPIYYIRVPKEKILSRNGHVEDIYEILESEANSMDDYRP